MMRKQFSAKDQHGSTYGGDNLSHQGTIKSAVKLRQQMRREEPPPIKVREVLAQNRNRSQLDISRSRNASDNGAAGQNMSGELGNSMLSRSR